jgi:AbrB family looped-hinge helix DNA binding protein
MLVKLTSKGRVTIPKKVRSLMNLSPGDFIDFSVEKRKVVLCKHFTGTSARLLRGLLHSKVHYSDGEIRRSARPTPSTSTSAGTPIS